LGRRRRESRDRRGGKNRKYQRMKGQIRDHRNVLRASSLGTKGRTGQGPTIGRKNPPPFDMTAVQIAERWDLMLMLICETLSPLPIEIKQRERDREREMS